MFFLRSSIARKFIMGLSGLGLCGFVLSHMAGNLLLLAGPKVYNLYAYKLTSTPLIYVMEAGLVALFLIHAFFGILLSIENRRARSKGYANCGTTGDKKAHFASRTMIFQGLILLVFLITHLAHFKYGEHFEVTYDGVVMRDLYKLVVSSFSHSGFLLWYLLSLVLLAMHLSHGFSSAFQSLGFYHPRYTPWLRCFGYVYALIVSVGFLAPPLRIFFTR